jgi:hypothetical protein
MSQLTHSDIPADFRADFGDELRAPRGEPLLPIEKKLIGFSLGIGLFLLAVLAVVNHLFPVAP